MLEKQVISIKGALDKAARIVGIVQMLANCTRSELPSYLKCVCFALDQASPRRRDSGANESRTALGRPPSYAIQGIDVHVEVLMRMRIVLEKLMLALLRGCRKAAKRIIDSNHAQSHLCGCGIDVCNPQITQFPDDYFRRRTFFADWTPLMRSTTSSH